MRCWNRKKDRGGSRRRALGTTSAMLVWYRSRGCYYDCVSFFTSYDTACGNITASYWVLSPKKFLSVGQVLSYWYGHDMLPNAMPGGLWEITLTRPGSPTLLHFLLDKSNKAPPPPEWDSMTTIELGWSPSVPITHSRHIINGIIHITDKNGKLHMVWYLRREKVKPIMIQNIIQNFAKPFLFVI